MLQINSYPCCIIKLINVYLHTVFRSITNSTSCGAHRRSCTLRSRSAMARHALEDTVSCLQQLNHTLEEKIYRRCEAPFISDVFGRYEYLTRERGNLIAKLEYLQETASTLFSPLTSSSRHRAPQRKGEGGQKRRRTLQPAQNLMLRRRESGRDRTAARTYN